LNIFKNRKKTTYDDVTPLENMPSECNQDNVTVM
jgi:hypothetical protein